jgi:hypothetical protein
MHSISSSSFSYVGQGIWPNIKKRAGKQKKEIAKRN